MLGKTNIQWATAARQHPTSLSSCPSRHSGKKVEIRRPRRYNTMISHFGCFPLTRSWSGHQLERTWQSQDKHELRQIHEKHLTEQDRLHSWKFTTGKVFAGLHNSLTSQNTKHKSLAWVACPHSNQDFDFRTVDLIGYSAGSPLTCILLFKKTRPF